jgi:5'-3' exonuclease
MKEQKFENYFGRKIAVDASMHIYSFLVCCPCNGETDGAMHWSVAALVTIAVGCRWWWAVWAISC